MYSNFPTLDSLLKVIGNFVARFELLVLLLFSVIDAVSYIEHPRGVFPIEILFPRGIGRYRFSFQHKTVYIL